MNEEEEFEKWKEKNGKSDEYMDGHIDDKDFDDYEDDKETVYDTDEDVEDDKVIPEKSEDTEDSASSIDEIKDLILNLSTKVDDLTQKVLDDEAEEENADDTLADEGFGDDIEGEDPFAEEGTEGGEGEGEPIEGGEGEGFNGDVDPFAEEGGEGESTEGGEGEPQPSEGGEGESQPSEGGNETEEPQDYAGEDSSEGENTETRKNEAWLRAKETGLLNLNSGSLISKLFNERYYDIDEAILEVAKRKIRKLIDNARQNFVNKAKSNEG